MGFKEVDWTVSVAVGVSGMGFKEADWTVSVAVGGGLDGTPRLEVLHERERECVGEMCACRKAGMKRKRG